MYEKTFYYLYPDGSITARTVVGDGPITHPEGVVLLSREEYEQRLAAIEAQRAQEAEDTRAAETEQKRLDYLALIALGLPPETASRITGYVPPPEPEPDEQTDLPPTDEPASTEESD
ncbi:hypothetical protein ACFOOM_00825 [Streptomyces echinoruber]|uniref:Uncharacterized protein n=1 Tax=Streptomyces echinoruber TaxID=68898 RepID=A0A918QU00_9ACTN|nr:hypothetical protein [Streptomyces echinoruber]GGZ73350.1 hypothetical protein GCM10010389_08700 [Streptomyces echinoruber]